MPRSIPGHRPPVRLALVAGLLVAATGASSPPAGAARAASVLAPAAPTTAANAFRAADLDRTRDPCRDFDGYVNARWRAAHPVPPDRTTWGTFEILGERSLETRHRLAEQAAATPGGDGPRRIVGDLWATGMDEARIDARGLAPVQADLDAIARLTDADAIAAYLRTTAAEGRNPLFAIESRPALDARQVRVNTAVVRQGGLGLPDAGFYLGKRAAPLLEAYTRHVARMLALSGVPDADAAAQAEDVVAFEKRLAGASKLPAQLFRDARQPAAPTTAAEADALTPHFSWTRLLAAEGMAPSTPFQLQSPDFHREVDRMLADTPVATWQHYLRFHALDDAAPYLSAPFEQAHFDFHGRTLRRQTTMKPRWKRVLDAIDATAGEAMGRLYTEATLPEARRAQAQALVRNVYAALGARLDDVAWLTPDTRRKARERWAGIDLQIGHPQPWPDLSGLRTSRDGFLENVRAAQAFAHRRTIAAIGQPADANAWDITPQTVNGYYDPAGNRVVLTAALLQPPFFDPDADDALNYGGLGVAAGQALTSAFDFQSSGLDAGNRWTDADIRGFDAVAEKLVAQFDAYEVAPGVHADGRIGLAGNFADLGGLELAHDALRRATAGRPDPKVDGLARDQRFFLDFGVLWRRNYRPGELEARLRSDPHSPANLRAIGAPSNMPAFADAFQCKAGDPMVRPPETRVRIW